jgi:WD40-like Beta Propeller Repeat
MTPGAHTMARRRWWVPVLRTVVARVALVAVSLVAVSLVAVSLVLAPTSVQAQVDPRGAMRTLSTPHLRVHVRKEQEALGRRAAAIAEQAYAQLARELVPPAGPIDMLIADNVDYSNGFAQVFPTNRVVIYAVPPVASTELRFHDDWLQLVITHELAHIFHIDRAGGLWRAGRWLFGRNPLLFPNAFTPSWVKEGLAVHYESRLTGSGRLVSPESRTVARAAARDEALPPIRRWSLATSRFPQGQTAYGYGALLMDRSARLGGDSGMRRFVDGTATFPVPFLLNRASRRAFGTSFSAQFAAMRDSLRSLAAGLDTTGDRPWQIVDGDGFNAESPRWRSADTLQWVASNGRDVTGVFVADVGAITSRGSNGSVGASDTRAFEVRRVARRNGLDVNAPWSAGRTVFAQSDYRNPYEFRSDLYVGDGDDERRLTHGARLSQPDVRRDGAIVALQLKAASTDLVRVDTTGQVTVLREGGTWADPRWSPDGTRLVAVEFLPGGVERVVVMDTSGVARHIVAGARAVFASPSFTPTGRRVVYASDRSGSMQLETAPVPAPDAPVDTLSWRDGARASASASASGGSPDGPRQASRVSTGVYQPSVSPDGRWVAALLYGVDGFFVSVAPLDTAGPPARNSWYPAAASPALATGGGAARSDVPFTRYNPLRQLLPRYWLPQIGTGRLGQSTYGLSTSSIDILGRHEWVLSALVDPERGETDAAAAYRYRGLGVPTLDLSVSQQWDATFRIVDSSGNTLGRIARRRRFATLASAWSVPRIRTSVSGTLGVQYELRDFTATVDSLLGPPDALLRRGTRYPVVFANTSISTARLGARAISVEEGIVASTSSSYRWREDAPSLASWRHIGQLRGYVPLDLPGFSRHVLMARVAAAVTDENAATELSVGGVSGISSELLPGVVIGDPGRTFPVRGVAPGVQRGTRALGGSVEYRAPLVLVRDAPDPFMIFLDKLSLTLFTDAAHAWCPGALAARQTALCERPRVRDGWMASAGAELAMDLAVQYDTPYRLRVGGAAPYIAPAGIARGGAFYVTLGSRF